MPDVFMIDSAYIESKRDEIRNEIASARVLAGGAWYVVPIQSTDVLNDGSIEVKILIDNIPGNITITTVALYANNGMLIGRKTVSIFHTSADEGFLYIIRFSLLQVYENESDTGAYDAL